MKIQVTLTPAEIRALPELDLSRTTCVVFDVLRATSTMTTALEYGAAAIYPVASIEEARLLQEKHPQALLGGERHGERIEGFDLGNSPLEYRDLAGREIISTTTNGTVALQACAGAGEILAASLLNIDAVAAHLRHTGAEIVRIVCAGTGQHFALEDALGGGALIAHLPGAECSDAAAMLLALWHASSADPLAAIAQSLNGSRLIARGRGEEVTWCAQNSVFSSVGRMVDGCLRALTA